MRVPIAVLLLLVASSARARRPIPPEQWDPVAHVWLARAYIAESGWEARRDWRAISWVLARRWAKGVERFPRLRFVDVVRGYCAGMGARVWTRRQRWLRGLDFAAQKPPAWPRRASWEDARGHWVAALRMAWRWADGRVGDPCRGAALHWGGPGLDPPRGRMFRVDCGETLNVFYGMRK